MKVDRKIMIPSMLMVIFGISAMYQLELFLAQSKDFEPLILIGCIIALGIDFAVMVSE